MKLLLVTILLALPGFMVCVIGEEAGNKPTTVTKLEADKPKMEDPAIAIPEIDALRLLNAQKDLTINQYQINEYWKVITTLQEKVKKDGEVIQSLTVKVFTDAKVDRKDYKISEDGLRLEKIANAVAQSKSEGGK